MRICYAAVYRYYSQSIASYTGTNEDLLRGSGLILQSINQQLIILVKIIFITQQWAHMYYSKLTVIVKMRICQAAVQTMYRQEHAISRSIYSISMDFSMCSGN
jgi:hypothetical protein